MNHLVLSDEEIKELVIKITTARYDSISKLFEQLSLQFIKNANLDSKRGRYKLSSHLHNISSSCYGIFVSFSRAWGICKDKMNMSNEDNNG